MFGLKRRKRPIIRTARKLFHGVAIKAGPTACNAAQDLAKIRYLSDDAPILPLAECTNPAGCTCTYEHFDDRRTQLRRDTDVGLPKKDYPGDSRVSAGRRVTDR